MQNRNACSGCHDPRRNKPLSGRFLRKLDQELEEALGRRCQKQAQAVLKMIFQGPLGGNNLRNVFSAPA